MLYYIGRKARKEYSFFSFCYFILKIQIYDILRNKIDLPPNSLVTCLQASKAQNAKANPGIGLTPELRKTSSFDKTQEHTVAKSVAYEFVAPDEASNNKPKDSKGAIV